MNYMAEIKAFYDLVQVKQLSTGQIALWHGLMHINNKCAWIEWFTVPNLTLELHTGLSRSGIYKARNVLKQHGLIDFKPNGTKATSYMMISLLNSKQGSVQESNQTTVPMTNSKQGSVQDGKQDSKQGSNQDSNQSSNTLNKQDNTRQDDINTSTSTAEVVLNSDEDFTKLARLYQQCGFDVDGLTSEWLKDMLAIYGFEFVKNALEEAAFRGKKNRKYAKGILENWKANGGMTLGNERKDKAKTIPIKKTRFHTEESRTDKYSAADLDEIAARKRREYTERMRQGG